MSIWSRDRCVALQKEMYIILLLSFIILYKKRHPQWIRKQSLFILHKCKFMKLHSNLLGFKDRQSRNPPPLYIKWFQSFLLKIINLGNIKSYTKSKASKCKSTFVGHWHAWISLSFCSSWTSPGCLSNERWNSEQMTSESSQFFWMSLIALFCAMRTLSLDW